MYDGRMAIYIVVRELCGRTTAIETIRKRNGLSRVVIYFLMYREKKKKKKKDKGKGTDFYPVAPRNVWNINFPLFPVDRKHKFFSKNFLSVRVTCAIHRGKVIAPACTLYTSSGILSAVLFSHKIYSERQLFFAEDNSWIRLVAIQINMFFINRYL